MDMNMNRRAVVPAGQKRHARANMSIEGEESNNSLTLYVHTPAVQGQTLRAATVTPGRQNKRV